MFPSSYHHEIFRSYHQGPGKVHAKFRGQRSRSQVKTQHNHFRTVTPVWIHIWWWNDTFSWMLLRRGALLFFKVIRQISRSHSAKKLRICKTPVRIILWCPITKMVLKACFLIQPLEQEGGCQKCCISLCSKVFINHFYQMKASPECLNILTYQSRYRVDRLRRTPRRKI